MKLNLLFFLSLLVVANGYSQGSVKIHCTFAGAASDSCTIIPSEVFIDEYEHAYRSRIVNNSCDFSFTILKPTVAKLIYNHQSTQIFIEGGNTMELAIANDSLQSAITFSGDNSSANKFFSSFQKKFKSYYDDAAITATILNSDVDGFEMKLYDQRQQETNFFKAADKLSFSEAFDNYIFNTVRYNYYARLLSFPIIKANQSATILTVGAFPDVMLDGIDQKIVNDAALNTKAYRDALYYFDVYFTSAANGYNKFRDLSISMESKVVTANKYYTGQSLAWFVANYLNENVEKVSLYTAKHIYGVLAEKDTKGVYMPLLKKKVAARLAMNDAVANAGGVEPANASSQNNTSNGGFPKLKDIDGKYFTFDDLKGKVVYVDYWASWCGPCRSQMPSSKALHEMFTPQQLKQLVFLYISIDESEEAWKSAVQQIGMEGKVAISPGNWNSEIAKYFQINSIPRYMLIDKKGNIVDLNAKRPSSGTEIYGDILKLLE